MQQQAWETMAYAAIAFFVLGGGFLITAAILFFKFRIRTVRRDLNGSLERRQIEEIRLKSDAAARQRGQKNIFEELEKKAKPKKNSASSIRLFTTTEQPPNPAEQGTTVLRKSAQSQFPDFMIEKDILFVSTNEVI